MIARYFLFTLTVLFCVSCNKQDNPANTVITSDFVDKWWKVECIEIDQSAGYNTISGTFDYGRFYFGSDGSCLRQTEELPLAVCNSADTVLNLNTSDTGGWGVPFGEIGGTSTVKTWQCQDVMLHIIGYGTWKIENYSPELIRFTSSKTNYLYLYTLTDY